MTRDEAQALKDEVDMILEEAQCEDNDTKLAMGAVNFGDLRCTDVRLDHSLINSGDAAIVVCIEDARRARGCRRYVYAHLSPSKWGKYGIGVGARASLVTGIEVRTEW